MQVFNQNVFQSYLLLPQHWHITGDTQRFFFFFFFYNPRHAERRWDHSAQTSVTQLTLEHGWHTLWLRKSYSRGADNKVPNWNQPLRGIFCGLFFFLILPFGTLNDLIVTWSQMVSPGWLNVLRLFWRRWQSEKSSSSVNLNCFQITGHYKDFSFLALKLYLQLFFQGESILIFLVHILQIFISKKCLHCICNWSRKNIPVIQACGLKTENNTCGSILLF